MRAIIFATLAILISSPALADVAEGKIKKIDPKSLLITLDDGNKYKLTNEFDLSALTPGLEVYLSYDKVDNANIVTDMDIWQSEN